MVKQIFLTQDKIALVDDEDFGLVSQFTWCAVQNRPGGNWYAATPGCKLYMHNLVCKVPKGLIVDHRSRDGLDNRKDNLRSATLSQNQANCRKASGTSSKFLGVCLDLSQQRWKASCRGVNLGRFTSEEAAAKAYDDFAVEAYGEFANLNFKS